VTRGLALFLSIVSVALYAGVPARAAGPAAATSAGSSVRLTTISSRDHAGAASLVIEATEPVAYVATHPDPLTILLDFRNVATQGFANHVQTGARSPIARVALEPAESLGTPVTRLRISLTRPVAHHVRSDRRTVVVDFEKAGDRPYVLPPVSRTAAPQTAALQDTGSTGVVGLAAASTRPGSVDPIVALGLDRAPVVASGTPAVPAAPMPKAPSAPPSGRVLAVRAAQAGQSAQPPTPAGAVAEDQPGARRFTGHPVSLDFQGADLRAVLRTFSEISGLNMVIDPKVKGSVDVALHDVPWDQALDIILRANGLDWRVDGTIVRIAPRETFTAEDKSLTEATEARTAAQQLTTLTRRLSYAKGEDLVKLLKDTRALTKYGQAQVDARTNTLIIADVPAQLPRIGDLLDTLDRPQPQVEIEARIVQTNKNYAKALGVQWGFNGRATPALGNTTGLAFPNSGSLAGGIDAKGTAVNLPAQNSAFKTAPSAVGLALGSINGAFNLDIALSALESSGNGRLLSSPRVTTQNNIQAEMTQGVQIPIQVVSNNTTTVAFKDAALTLKVVPQITASNTVIMQIAVENSSPDFSHPGQNGVPAINTQRANTTVLVIDGETTVIGGISTSQQTTTNDRTPGLGRVPFLSWLFKRDSTNDDSTELLIFITPRIIKS
jgi:type IV pilus assembly protein PilQ